MNTLDKLSAGASLREKIAKMMASVAGFGWGIADREMYFNLADKILALIKEAGWVKLDTCKECGGLGQITVAGCSGTTTKECPLCGGRKVEGVKGVEK